MTMPSESILNKIKLDIAQTNFVDGDRFYIAIIRNLLKHEASVIASDIDR